jgi:hypothetical protein
MSEAARVSDIVSMSIGGDSSEVKSAIGDVLQQKITVALENKKKDFAQTFLTKTETDSKEPESSEEITNGS